MNYTVLESIVAHDTNAVREQFAIDVLMGLSCSQKYLSSQYLYDDIGSQLFSEICNQPEYYPTNIEADIFEAHKLDIARHIKGEHVRLIELGAGDGRKTKILLQSFLEQGLDFTYVPIDISEEAMRALESTIMQELPQINMQGIVGEYFAALEHLDFTPGGRDIVMFLGSNIGNFPRGQAIAFLRRIWNYLHDGDYLFIGFDLKKEISILLKAYNDSKGVTKRFNLNILTRINRELDGEFCLDNFYHYGFYNPSLGAMESHLIAKCAHDVLIGGIGKRFHFEPFETIHLEYSYKYHDQDIARLASDVGYSIEHTYTDPNSYFTDALCRVNKVNAT